MRESNSRARAARIAVAVAAGAAVTVLGAAGASAAPRNGDLIEVTCENGKTYEGRITPGNPEFNPAITFDGGALVPKAFGPVTFTVYDDEWTELDSQTEPAKSHGSPNMNLMHCEFIGGGSFVDGGESFHYTFEGTAEAIIPGSLK